MRHLFPIVALFFSLWLSLPGVGQTSSPPAPPSDFDSSAAAPPGLPAELNLPINTRMSVKAWRIKPIPPTPQPQPNDPRLTWAPDMNEAMFERGPKDIHAVFHWEGGRTSEAFVIRGISFRMVTFAYPDQVAATSFPLGFYLNRQVGSASGGGSGDFPGISWYSPSFFAGKASLNGSDVLVFTPDGKKPGVTTFPDGLALCLDAKTLLPTWLDDREFIFSFSYSPASNVQINPQGPYLEAIQKQFGHYP